MDSPAGRTKVSYRRRGIVSEGAFALESSCGALLLRKALLPRMLKYDWLMSRLRQHSVLVIDDDETLLVAIERFLRKKGLDVVTSNTALGISQEGSQSKALSRCVQGEGQARVRSGTSHSSPHAPRRRPN